MSLRQIIEQRRAEDTAPRTHACYSLTPNATVLEVTASDGEYWQLPWQQFTSARHGKEGEHDASVLTFLTHVVELRGFHFAPLREAIRERRLAFLRVAPTKYCKAAEGDLFIEVLHVRRIDEAGA